MTVIVPEWMLELFQLVDTGAGVLALLIVMRLVKVVGVLAADVKRVDADVVALKRGRTTPPNGVAVRAPTEA